MSAFLPHALVVPEGRHEGRLALVLHGILGNHKNWRTFGRLLSRQLPGWRFALVDLRNHGASHGAAGPHTLAACADDLEHLAAHLGATVEVVIGHSFGGKVALEVARRAGPGLSTVYVLDASPQKYDVLPGADHEVMQVLTALDAVPQPLPKRGDVVQILAEHGMPETIGRWMTTNLRREGDGFVWTFDLRAAQELLADYFATDLWAPLTTSDPTAPQVHLVRAGRSDRWPPDVLAQLDALPHDARGTVHLLPNAGHWVHVDDPGGLMDLLVRTFPT